MQLESLFLAYVSLESLEGTFTELHDKPLLSRGENCSSSLSES